MYISRTRTHSLQMTRRDGAERIALMFSCQHNIGLILVRQFMTKITFSTNHRHTGYICNILTMSNLCELTSAAKPKPLLSHLAPLPILSTDHFLVVHPHSSHFLSPDPKSGSFSIATPSFFVQRSSSLSSYSIYKTSFAKTA